MPNIVGRRQIRRRTSIVKAVPMQSLYPLVDRELEDAKRYLSPREGSHAPLNNRISLCVGVLPYAGDLPRDFDERLISFDRKTIVFYLDCYHCPRKLPYNR
jgi:hypothetical protein